MQNYIDLDNKKLTIVGISGSMGFALEHDCDIQVHINEHGRKVYTITDLDGIYPQE